MGGCSCARAVLSAPVRLGERTPIEAGSLLGESEDGDSRRLTRPAQQGDAALATLKVATGPNRWGGAVLRGVWEVCGGRLTHGADGSGAGAKY